MKPLILCAVAGLVGSTAMAQTAPGKALGSWVVEYDHTVVHMHGEPTRRHEHGRMTLRSVGDSLLGELVVGDSGVTTRSVLRGTARNNAWTVYADDPPANGMGIFFSAVGSMMDWLRETVHGIPPVVVRFDLTAKGDSLAGSRTVTGGISNTPRTSQVSGKRLAPNP